MNNFNLTCTESLFIKLLFLKILYLQMVFNGASNVKTISVNMVIINYTDILGVLVLRKFVVLLVFEKLRDADY